MSVLAYLTGGTFWSSVFVASWIAFYVASKQSVGSSSVDLTRLDSASWYTFYFLIVFVLSNMVQIGVKALWG